jgi:Fe-S-cluster-containing dehydrogenase component
VLACPFGVPEVFPELELMMKCDMCFDRTSMGLGPMCATVCPSGALTYRSPDEIARSRREVPSNVFYFGVRKVTTKVYMMVPPGTDAIRADVVDYMWEGDR